METDPKQQMDAALGGLSRDKLASKPAEAEAVVM